MDYDVLSNQQFEAIVADVRAKGGYDIDDLEANRWLGTIFISLRDMPITEGHY